jgi:MIP family channel proteins
MQPQTRKYAAEFIGTFALVLVGAGAVIAESHTGKSHFGVADGKVGLVGIAFAHGMTLAAMIYALGSISGAHFNPAVSFAMWLRQKLDPPALLGYILAQLSGALVAATCLAGLFPDEISLAGLGTPALGPRINATQGVLLEALITFLLVTIILFVTRKKNPDQAFAGLAIGATLTALIFFAGPLTGAGANPARYLGPALVAGKVSEAFVYVVGPMVGGGAAAFLFAFVTDSLPALDFGAPPGDEPEPVPAGASFSDADEEPEPQGPRRAKTPHAILRRAHELFVEGEGEKAAQMLVPVLARLDEYSSELINKARSLLIVIEEEHGRMPMLDAYQHLIYQTVSRRPS